MSLVERDDVQPAQPKATLGSLPNATRPASSIITSCNVRWPTALTWRSACSKG